MKIPPPTLAVFVACWLGCHALAAQPLLEGDNSPRRDAIQSTIPCKVRVTDSQGTPLAGAKIAVVGFQKCEKVVLRFHHGEMASCDSAGLSEVELPRGKTISATHLIVYQDGFAFGTLDVSSATRLNSILGIRLAKSGESVMHVFDPKGEPIPGAELRMFSKTPESPQVQSEDWGRFGLPTPTSDDSGVMRIPVQFPGKTFCYEIKHQDFPVFKRRDQKLEQNMKVELVNGRKVDVRVTCLSDRAAESETIVQALVNTPVGSYRETVEIDATGRGSIVVPSEGASLHAYHPKYVGDDLYSGRMSKAGFWMYPYMRIAGQVVELNSGAPAEGVELSVYSRSEVIKTVLSDSAGHFSVLAPATPIGVSVRVNRSDGWLPDRDVAMIVKPSNHPGKDEIVLPRAFFVNKRLPWRGQVVTADGAPAPNVIVGSLHGFVVTDEEGRFSLKPPVNNGTMLTFTHAHRTLSGMMVVKDERQNGTTKSLKLTDERAYFGRVIDQQGEPLSGADVCLRAVEKEVKRRLPPGIVFPPQLQTIFSTKTRADGTFRFIGLPSDYQYSPVFPAERGLSYAPMQVQGSAVERARRSTVLPDVAIEAIRRQVQQREPAPSRLLPFDCKRWYNTEESLQVDQLEGQSVLLCLGYSPLPLPLLEVCHQVYGQRGLAVIHVGLSVADGKGMGESFEEMFRKRNPSFPVGHDTGATMKRYGVTNSRILLYDQHHQLVSDSINPHDFRAIRNHMLSSHD